MGIWHPWPLSEPEMRMRALGLDLLATEGCLLVTLQDLGPGDLPPGLSPPPGSAARSRLPLHDGCIRFAPLAPDPKTGAPRLDVTVLASLDVGSGAVGDGLISFALKAFAPLVYRNAVATCRRLFHSGAPVAESPMLRRQQERAALYVPQALSIDRFLRARGWAEQLPLLPALRELLERDRGGGDGGGSGGGGGDSSGKGSSGDDSSGGGAGAGAGAADKAA